MRAKDLINDILESITQPDDPMLDEPAAHCAVRRRSSCGSDARSTISFRSLVAASMRFSSRECHLFIA